MNTLELMVEIIERNQTICKLIIDDAISKMEDYEDAIIGRNEINLIKTLINKNINDEDLADIVSRIINKKEKALHLLTETIEKNIKNKENFKEYILDEINIYDVDKETKEWIEEISRSLKCEKCDEDLFDPSGAGILVPGTKAYYFNKTYNEFVPAENSFEEDTELYCRCGNCNAIIQDSLIEDYL